MDVCLLSQDGEIRRQRPRQPSPETWLTAMAPSRADLVVAVDGLLTWDWRADRCAQAQMPCVLGPALSMKALPGGQATHDTIDAQNSAVRRRGGRLPQASVYPAERRATRDLLRRR
jgi:transposase